MRTKVVIRLTKRHQVLKQTSLEVCDLDTSDRKHAIKIRSLRKFKLVRHLLEQTLFECEALLISVNLCLFAFLGTLVTNIWMATWCSRYEVNSVFEVNSRSLLLLV